MNELTGAEILIASLIEQGTELAFGYPGGCVLDMYDALYKNRESIRHVLTSHEQGAAHAADGFSRTTGKTGVVFATSGPGATNLVTGLATAYLDSVPIIAVTGNVPRHLQGKDSFQEVDITGVTISVTKHNFFIRDTKKIPEIIKKAFEIANSGRLGPVLVDIPKDVLIAKAEYVPAGKFMRRPDSSNYKTKFPEVLELIANAKKPVILFGGGVKAAEGTEQLIAFADKLDAPLVTTTMGLSTLPYNYPKLLGLIGMHGNVPSNYAVDNADLLIAVGTRFSDRVIGDASKFSPNSKLIHIDLDTTEINKNLPVTYFLNGNCKEIMEDLRLSFNQKVCHDWWKELSECILENPPHNPEATSGVDPLKIINAVASVTNNEAYVVTDVGQHQILVAQNYPFTKPRSFASSLGLGTMGYGMGAANGVQIAHPESPVVLFTGDGSFHMNLNEFAVSVTENLPIVVIVFNNHVLGMIRQWQERFYKTSKPTSVTHRKTDFAKLADAFGGKGYKIEKDDEITDTIIKAFQHDGPVIIDCNIDSEYGVYPFIPAGKSFKNIIKSKDDI